jgi:hypothetical protein
MMLKPKANAFGLSAAALLVAFVMVVGSPLGASASEAVYFNGNVKAGTWKSSYDRSSRNTAKAGLAIQLQVQTFGVTATGDGAVSQSYALQTTWEYCRATLPATLTIPLVCTVNLG